MINGEVDGKFMRIEIIEGRDKEEFERILKKAISNGAIPLFESFTSSSHIEKYVNYDKDTDFFIHNKYSVLVVFDDTDRSIWCNMVMDDPVEGEKPRFAKTKKSKGYAWEEVEDAILIDGIKREVGLMELSIYLNRSESAIRGRLDILKAKGDLD